MMDVVESQNMTIATIRRVPVDLIIHTLAERFKDSTEEGHDRLAMGLYACIDSNGLAEEWAVSGGVAQTAEWMATVITGRDSWREPTAAETRVAEVAVSKRLLTVAANLCVTQDAEDHTAATALLQAASRILGVSERKTAAPINDYYDDEHPNAKALFAAREQLLAALGLGPGAMPMTLRELIAILTGRHAAAIEAKRTTEALLMNAKSDLANRDLVIAEVRAPIDAALGTTKDAPTFTLKQVAEELAAQHVALRRENKALMERTAHVRDTIIDRDSANLGRALAVKENDKRVASLIAERDAANEAHRIDAMRLQEELAVAIAVSDRVISERDAAEEARRQATIRAVDVEAAADMARKAAWASRSWTAASRSAVAMSRPTIERLTSAVNDAIATRPVEASTNKAKPGDMVPWAEVEDGALYFDAKDRVCPFLMRQNGREGWLMGPGDWDVMHADVGFGRAGYGVREAVTEQAILVARDLGSDPEAWRKAMREWIANGSKPTTPARA